MKYHINLSEVKTMIPFKIPNPFNMKRTLFIQPHPDDNDIGAGATIAKLVDKGVEVHYLTVTDGGSGSTDKTLFSGCNSEGAS
ncbi:PIG-L deacetylase family protein [Virgibacillus sp. JSM 102003]|uniref:PIG-L deacetylase family protein n=1 Tax=Virgibacillus sp. JSM 102003 TaxID=1562108 RepID=UPI0035C1AD27